VTVRAEVEAAIRKAAETGRTLRGVFHAAGVLDDRMLTDVEEESVKRVLGPKLRGARNLHDATIDEDNMDHFVLFSSAATWLGGPGQTAYAAANECMAALAEERRASGRVATTIDWGAWAGSGMAGRMDQRARSALERKGMRLLDPREALDAMRALLSSNTPRALVADIDWSRVAETGRPFPALLRRLEPDRGDAPARESAPDLDLREFGSLPSEERRVRVEAFVITSLGAVLGLGPDRLEPDTGVRSLGFDSLMAIELRNRIDMSTGITVPSADVLDATTVGQIAEHLLVRLEARMLEDSLIDGGDISGPTDIFEF